MSTIAVVGAGSGLGLSIAKIFGRQGFRVAVVSRDRENLDRLVSQLAAEEIDAAAFTADVMDRPTVVDAFARIKRELGAVDVLEYSPGGRLQRGRVLANATALDVTVEDMQPYIEWQLYGAMTAAAQVLPEMVERGSGTLFFTTGGSSKYPMPKMGYVGTSMAALRHWILALQPMLAKRGVYAAHVSWFGPPAPGESWARLPETAGEVYWEMYRTRTEAERFVGEIPAELLEVP
jgi:NAD(P)-dependent dehydrogenase (short-subunit alcohol dehydrogenase family)